jgi:hypothetical protein
MGIVAENEVVYHGVNDSENHLGKEGGIITDTAVSSLR